MFLLVMEPIGQDTDDIDCGLLGYDILNNIPHYKPIRGPYVFLNNDNFDQLQGIE